MKREYPDWLRKAAAKGGTKSRRKLSKKEARRIAMVRWAAGAGRDAVKASKQSGARSHTAKALQLAEENRPQ